MMRLVQSLEGMRQTSMLLIKNLLHLKQLLVRILRLKQSVKTTMPVHWVGRESWRGKGYPSYPRTY